MANKDLFKQAIAEAKSPEARFAKENYAKARFA